MAVFRPFHAIRPTKERAADIAALPYDVMSSKEAREITREKPWSFLHVDLAEVDLPEGTDPYSEAVYERAAANLKRLVEKGALLRDPDRCYYLYQEIMNGRKQTGIVGCASVEDYLGGVIKKHELTVRAKEEDRVRHVDACNANTGLIFLAFRECRALEERMEAITSGELPLYDFASEDGVRHRVWKVAADEDVALFEESFQAIPALYIADGHHRTASAARVGQKRREENPGFTGEEEFNFFLAAAFPASQLKIMDYNRLVADLGGLGREEFLHRIEACFAVEKLPEGEEAETEEELLAVRPVSPRTISMYLGGSWYRLNARQSAYDGEDPVERLDVSILQNCLLGPVLGIQDPRTDSRIAFVGGIRGLRELKCRVDRGEAVCAFAMYPTQMEELMAIADANRIMPPKSTWFEPKLRSGLFIHALS